MAVAPQINEDLFGTKVFTITFTIRDADNSVDRVDAGYLEVTADGGATITGNGTNTLTIVGNQGPCNTAMANFNYVPSADFTEDVGLSYAQVNDFDAATHNDFMLMSNRNTHDEFKINTTLFTYNEDEIVTLNLAEITDLRGDTLPDTQYTVTLTLSDPNAGVFSQNPIAGTKSEVNAILQNITFTPSADYTNNFTLSYSQQQDTDGINHGQAVITVTIGAIHDEFSVGSEQAYQEDFVATWNIGSITDVRGDTLPSTMYTIHLAFSDPDAGTLTGWSQFPSNSGIWSATGTKEILNTKLSAVEFRPLPDNDDDFTVTYSQNNDTDSVAQGEVVINITGTGTPDFEIYTPQTYLEHYVTEWQLGKVTDPLNHHHQVTLTLSDNNAGRLIKNVQPEPIISYDYGQIRVDNDAVTKHGLTWDGTYFWILGYSYDSSETLRYKNYIIQLTENGELTGINYLLEQSSVIYVGITFLDNHFWVADSNDTIRKYDSAGVYTDTSFELTAVDRLYDLDNNGTEILVSSNKGLLRVTTDNETLESYNIYTELVAFDGNDYWGIDNNLRGSTLIRYTGDGGVETDDMYGTWFPYYGIVFKNGQLWYIDSIRGLSHYDFESKIYKTVDAQSTFVNSNLERIVFLPAVYYNKDFTITYQQQNISSGTDQGTDIIQVNAIPDQYFETSDGRITTSNFGYINALITDGRGDLYPSTEYVVKVTADDDAPLLASYYESWSSGVRVPDLNDVDGNAIDVYDILLDNDILWVEDVHQSQRRLTRHDSNTFEYIDNVSIDQGLRFLYIYDNFIYEISGTSSGTINKKDTDGNILETIGPVDAISVDRICFDGTFFWVYSVKTNSVSKNNYDGSYAGVTIPVSYKDTSQTQSGFSSFTFTGTHLCISQKTNNPNTYDRVYYTTNGSLVKTYSTTYAWSIAANETQMFLLEGNVLMLGDHTNSYYAEGNKETCNQFMERSLFSVTDVTVNTLSLNYEQTNKTENVVQGSTTININRD